MAATRTHDTVRHEDVRAGRMHVHFLRIGYVLRQLESERTDMQTNHPDRAVNPATGPGGSPDRQTRS